MSSPELSDLPRPDAEALAVSQALEQRILERIRHEGGWLSFHDYMQMALYEPGLGYYVAGARKFGEAGDFVTAPELGAVFARCMARQCAQLLSQDPSLQLLEFGAGSGRLLVDLLTELARLGCLPERYQVIEPSPDLQQRQQDTLAAAGVDWAERVVWRSTLPERGFRGIVIANEVLDAMPARRFRVLENGVAEMGVAEDDGRLVWRQGDVHTELAGWLPGECSADLPPSYETEMNPHVRPWLAALAGMADTLLVLLVDYGYPAREYYLPERAEGTLMACFRHRAITDPFVYPGLLDLTTHVDFSALANAALEHGLEVMGYTSQALFLMATGLEQWAQDFDPEDVEAQLRLSAEIKTLTLPSQMGERFKVMALGKGLDTIIREPLAGFVYGDQRASL